MFGFKEFEVFPDTISQHPTSGSASLAPPADRSENLCIEERELLDCSGFKEFELCQRFPDTISPRPIQGYLAHKNPPPLPMGPLFDLRHVSTSGS